MTASARPNIEVKFTRCSLCGSEIEETATDPCFIRVETKTGLWQMWTCHGACFKKCLTKPPEWPDEFAPVHF